MEEEVTGYQIETCFGTGGCPKRVLDSKGLTQALEEKLSDKQLKAFLKRRVQGPLRMHHEFRISVSDCPNACSRPQIVDVGLIGACTPEVSEESCSLCQACVDVCRENAISLEDTSPVVKRCNCLSCGQCVEVCPTGTLKAGTRGYRIMVGGKLGRHPQLATEMPGIYKAHNALEIVDKCLDHYQRHCLKGERFGEILERTAMNGLGREFENNKKKENL
jgi:dissimilatory sulfite reductase (desulfoviridin) alpha/beta subunit